MVKYHYILDNLYPVPSMLSETDAINTDYQHWRHKDLSQELVDRYYKAEEAFMDVRDELLDALEA